MVLAQKWPFFQLFFLGNISRVNVFYVIQEGKNDFLGYKNKSFKQSKNSPFFKGVNPWFWSKNGHFCNFFFFLPVKAWKISLTIFFNEKTPFYSIKTRVSKSRKSDIIPKGLTHGFGPKMSIFPTFSFRQHTPGKCLLQYSRRKKCLSRL